MQPESKPLKGFEQMSEKELDTWLNNAELNWDMTKPGMADAYKVACMVWAERMNRQAE